MEQPVNSRFFRHPSVAVSCFKDIVEAVHSSQHSCTRLDMPKSAEAAIQRLRLSRSVVQLGAFGAASANPDRIKFLNTSLEFPCIWQLASARKPTQLVGDDAFLLRALRFLSQNPLQRELNLACIMSGCM